jgi:hypothetical protein
MLVPWHIRGLSPRIIFKASAGPVGESDENQQRGIYSIIISNTYMACIRYLTILIQFLSGTL